MSEQLSRNRNDVLPLRLDEQIRRDEEESRKHVSKELQELARSGSYSRTQSPDYDVVYDITETDVEFQDVLDELDGITSRILEKEFDTQGKKSRSYVGNEDTDLKKYMEWFFLPEEVFDVRSIDVMADDTPAWNDIYWIAGYSSQEEDKREFGPFDSFEGPPLRYAMIAINDEEQESLFDYSVIESSRYHPQVKMDQYTEDGTFPQEVIEEGPESYLDYSG